MPNAGQTMPNVSVVRSEPLSARMDPEDLRELITTYQAYALKPVGALCSRFLAWPQEQALLSGAKKIAGATRAADRGVAWEAWA
jgi:hypothetical protein